MSEANAVVSLDWLCLFAMCFGFTISMLLIPFLVGFLNAVSLAPLSDFLADTSASRKSSGFFSSLHRGAVFVSRMSGLRAFLGRFLFYSVLIYARCFELALQLTRLLCRKFRLLRLLCRFLPFLILFKHNVEDERGKAVAHSVWLAFLLIAVPMIAWCVDVIFFS